VLGTYSNCLACLHLVECDLGTPHIQRFCPHLIPQKDVPTLSSNVYLLPIPHNFEI